MLLRAAIVMLVMLNLGAAGWWLLQPPAAANPSAAPLAGPSLQLLTEASPPPATPVSAVPAAAPLPPLGTAAAKAQDTASPAAAGAVCLRFGPFADARARHTAQARLQQAGVAAKPHDSVARDVRGWKVFLPALASREAALAVAERIKAAGVSDLFVMTDGEDSNSIALGRFGSEAAARRRQAELASKGFAAQVLALGGSPGPLWLEARLPETADRVGLLRIAPAQPLDCASRH